MARGFLSGFVCGSTVSVAVAAMASLSAGIGKVPHTGAAPGRADAPAEGAPAQAEPKRDADLATQPGTAVPVPKVDGATVDPAVIASPQRPSAGQAGGLATPPVPDSSAGVDIASASGASGGSAPLQPDAPVAEVEPSISTDPAQPPAPEPATAGAFDTPASENAPLPTPDPAPEPEAAPEVRTAIAPSPSIGTPGVSLVARGTEPASAPVADPVETQTDLTPITAFAAEFPDPEGKPLMAIVLIDTGATPASGAVGLAALDGFPYPLSFAIDASLPDAADRAAIYRAQGAEVLALTDLPAGAGASDVEVSISAALDAVPEAVGLLEGGDAGVQESRAISDQVTAILGATGHGLVLQSKGLNTAQKLAARAGVPAAALFRDFDSAGQTPVVIRRFLDQAAFRAGQESGVVMLGRVRPDTISALLLWGLQDRASRVALVPVSAVLKAQVAE